MTGQIRGYSIGRDNAQEGKQGNSSGNQGPDASTSRERQVASGSNNGNRGRSM